MSAMENTLAAAPGNEEQLQELHRTMKARAGEKTGRKRSSGYVKYFYGHFYDAAPSLRHQRGSDAGK